MSGETERTAAALHALAAQLGEAPSQVARTLLDELTRAFDEIDAGIAEPDGDAVARATHAARNSVLMLDDREMLDGLRALDEAFSGGDVAAAASARSQLTGRWEALATQLQAV